MKKSKFTTSKSLVRSSQAKNLLNWQLQQFSYNIIIENKNGKIYKDRIVGIDEMMNTLDEWDKNISKIAIILNSEKDPKGSILLIEKKGNNKFDAIKRINRGGHIQMSRNGRIIEEKLVVYKGHPVGISLDEVKELIIKVWNQFG